MSVEKMVNRVLDSEGSQLVAFRQVVNEVEDGETMRQIWSSVLEVWASDQLSFMAYLHAIADVYGYMVDRFPGIDFEEPEADTAEDNDAYDDDAYDDESEDSRDWEDFDEPEEGVDWDEDDDDDDDSWDEDEGDLFSDLESGVPLEEFDENGDSLEGRGEPTDFDGRDPCCTYGGDD